MTLKNNEWKCKNCEREWCQYPSRNGTGICPKCGGYLIKNYKNKSCKQQKLSCKPSCKVAGWEKEFKKKYPKYKYLCRGMSDFRKGEWVNIEELFVFIRRLLAQQLEELHKEYYFHWWTLVPEISKHYRICLKCGMVEQRRKATLALIESECRGWVKVILKNEKI